MVLKGEASSADQEAPSKAEGVFSEEEIRLRIKIPAADCLVALETILLEAADCLAVRTKGTTRAGDYSEIPEAIAIKTLEEDSSGAAISKATREAVFSEIRERTTNSQEVCSEVKRKITRVAAGFSEEARPTTQEVSSGTAEARLMEGVFSEETSINQQAQEGCLATNRHKAREGFSVTQQTRTTEAEDCLVQATRAKARAVACLGGSSKHKMEAEAFSQLLPRSRT